MISSHRNPTTMLQSILKSLFQSLGMFAQGIYALCKRNGPLHKAVMEDSLEAVKVLLDAGADINEKGKGGLTPLHRVAMRQLADGGAVARLLLERGADTTIKGSMGYTPLHMAAFLDAVEVAKALLDCGADMEAKDTLGRTPLHSVAGGNAEAATKVLIDSGANIVAQDEILPAADDFLGHRAGFQDQVFQIRPPHAFRPKEAAGKPMGGAIPRPSAVAYHRRDIPRTSLNC